MGGQGGGQTLPAALVDIDGTLVDSNYQHALAWFRALRRHGVVRPLWEIHRHIGMGGDHLVAELAGDDVEREAGDAIREAEGRLYMEMIDEVEPLPDARDALIALGRGGRAVVLASSSKPEEADRYLEEQELTAAGAVAVHGSLAELIEAIDDPPLGAEAGEGRDRRFRRSEKG